MADHMIFSRELLFYPSKKYLVMYTCTQLFGNLKGRILKSVTKRFEMGQQTAVEKRLL